MRKMRLSPTAMNRFFACPAQFEYGRWHKPKQTVPWLEYGIRVHALLEHDLDQDKATKSSGMSIAPQDIQTATMLKDYAELSGYKLTEKETKFQFEYGDIEFTGIIDAIGTWHGIPVLVDWKTTGKRWLVIGSRPPKGAGFQPVIYSLYSDVPNVHFIVSDGNTVDSFRFVCTETDVENLEQAVRLIQFAEENDYYPKNRGFMCQYCDFGPLCYGSLPKEELPNYYIRRTVNERENEE